MKKERFFERALVALSIAIVIILMHGCGGNKSLRNDDPNSRAPQEVYVYNYHLEKDAIKYKVARGMNTRMHSGWEIVVEKCVKDIDKSVTCYINVFNWGKDRNFDIMKDGSFMIDDYDKVSFNEKIKIGSQLHFKIDFFIGNITVQRADIEHPANAIACTELQVGKNCCIQISTGSVYDANIVIP